MIACAGSWWTGGKFVPLKFVLLKVVPPIIALVVIALGIDNCCPELYFRPMSCRKLWISGSRVQLCIFWCWLVGYFENVFVLCRFDWWENEFVLVSDEYICGFRFCEMLFSKCLSGCDDATCWGRGLYLIVVCALTQNWWPLWQILGFQYVYVLNCGFSSGTDFGRFLVWSFVCLFVFRRNRRRRKFWFEVASPRLGQRHSKFLGRVGWEGSKMG